jgi:hypothetical protein
MRVHNAGIVYDALACRQVDLADIPLLAYRFQIRGLVQRNRPNQHQQIVGFFEIMSRQLPIVPE